MKVSKNCYITILHIKLSEVRVIILLVETVDINYPKSNERRHNFTIWEHILFFGKKTDLFV
jgi:hypothetical protein